MIMGTGQPDLAGFYRAFEDAHRGSREAIKARQRSYLPMVERLRARWPRLRVLDLGCGRGEWLELLAEQGVEGLGVDLDEGMLAACRERDLNVASDDALACLQRQPEAGWHLITAFHVAEHLAFEQLHGLVASARRALVPGGVLLLETPNPENLVVGASRFYTDPTHNRPLPPALLAFLPTFHGFAESRVLGMQHPERLPEAAQTRLRDVLFAVSPDYAVVAQTPGPPDAAPGLQGLLPEDQGLWLEPMAARFETRLRAFEQAQRQLANDLQQQLGAELRRAREREQALRNSTSWRLTAPLRAASAAAQRLRGRTAGLPGRLRAAARNLAYRLLLGVRARPRVAHWLQRQLTRWPRLYGWLVRRARSLLVAPPPQAATGATARHLSRDAHEVYAALAARDHDPASGPRS